MKSPASIFLLLFIFFTYLPAYGLRHQSLAPLIEHLTEVNKEWAKVELPQGHRLIAFETEKERIQMHLRLVDSILSEKQVGHLCPTQQLNRKLRLLELRSYWQKGAFPVNTFHKKRQPYFVDIHNTACAVGHLMRESGAADAVERISKESNYAYVAELVKYPFLTDWADTNGFTADELAWIQPGYPPMEQPTYPVGNGGGANGRINAMFSNTSTSPIGVVIAGDFTEIDGVAANSIATWDGEEWHTHGEGINGKINAVAMLYGQLVVGGKFTLPGMSEEVNIARWENGTWHPLQMGDMEGEVLALQDYGQQLYVGGDFKKINGVEMPFLARYILPLNQWSQSGEVNGETVAKVLSVDGPVKCFDRNVHQLLICGDFKKIAVEANHPDIEPIETQYLAYWRADERQWIDVSFSGDYQPVLAVKIFDGYLVVGGNFNQPNPLSFLDAGVWNYGFYYYPLYDGLIHGFLEHEGRLIAYGGFGYDPVVGIVTNSIDELFFQGNYGEQIGFALDNTVTAATSHKGEAFFAGDFTMVNHQPFNGLFRSPLDGSTPAIHEEGGKTQVFQSGGQLYIEAGMPLQNASLQLFTTHGQLVFQQALPNGVSKTQCPIGLLSSGIYVYQIKGKGMVETGKVFMD